MLSLIDNLDFIEIKPNRGGRRATGEPPRIMRLWCSGLTCLVANEKTASSSLARRTQNFCMKLNIMQKTPKPLVTEASDSSVTKSMVKAIVTDAQKLGINAKQFSQHFSNVVGVMQTVGLTPEMVYEHLGFNKTDTKDLVATLDKIRVYGKSMAEFMKDCASRGLGPRRAKSGFPETKRALDAAGIDPFEAYEALGLYVAPESPQERKIKNYLADRTMIDENTPMVAKGFGWTLQDMIRKGLEVRGKAAIDSFPRDFPKTTAMIQKDGYTWEELAEASKGMK